MGYRRYDVLDTSDAFRVVATALELQRRMGDTFHAELAEVIGVKGVVGGLAYGRLSGRASTRGP